MISFVSLSITSESPGGVSLQGCTYTPFGGTITLSPSSEYQMGTSVWYHLLLLIGQSIEMPPIQSCKYCLFLSGMNLLLLDNSASLSRTCVCFTYHSLSSIISIGLPPLSLTGISCSLSSKESMQPESSSILVASILASDTFKPLSGPDIWVISPFKSIATNGLSPSSLNIATSF